MIYGINNDLNLFFILRIYICLDNWPPKKNTKPEIKKYTGTLWSMRNAVTKSFIANNKGISLVSILLPCSIKSVWIVCTINTTTANGKRSISRLWVRKSELLFIFSFEDKCIMPCKDTNYFAFIIMNYKIYYFNYNILIL